MVIVIFIACQVDTFSSVYKKLTGKDVTFEFPSYDWMPAWTIIKSYWQRVLLSYIVTQQVMFILSRLCVVISAYMVKLRP